MSLELWHVEQSVLQLAVARMSATVDVSRPTRGLHAVRIDARPLDHAELLAVELSPRDSGDLLVPSDLFRRGGDLAVTYVDQPQPAMRAQIYWRAASHRHAGSIAAIELQVSVETSLLDSSPTLTTRTALVADEAWQLSDAGRGAFERVAGDLVNDTGSAARNPPIGYLFRLAGSAFSYAEMVHPGDAHTSRCEQTGASKQVRLGHRLFAQRLEKGVILRARILGLLLDRAGDEAAAVEHFAAFTAAELPLTT